MDSTKCSKSTKFTSTEIEVWQCPVCLATDTRESLVFAHFLWKHPLEYYHLKKSNVSRSQMIIASNGDFVKGLLKKKFGKSTDKNEETLESCVLVRFLILLSIRLTESWHSFRIHRNRCKISNQLKRKTMLQQ